MNILFLTINFSSINENGIYTDLMKSFIDKGHKVFVVSANQRREAKMNEFSQQKNFYSIKVRTPNITSTNVIEKGISTLLFEQLYLNSIKKHTNNIKFDLILYSTPPITFSKVVQYVKMRDNSLAYLMLKDIFPQNAIDIGLIKDNSFLHKYFRVKEKELYRISDIIGVMSPKNKQYIISHNPEAVDKIEILPNAITPQNIENNHNLKENIFSKYHIPLNKRIFIYGGNLGKPQGIDFLIECIKENEKNINSFFIIVGFGTEYHKLDIIFKENYFKNAILIKTLPKNEYELLVKSCDVGLVFLDYKFTIPNFPSRILSYMQASIPVIVATDPNTDLGDIVEEGHFGVKVMSNDIRKFNKVIQEYSVRKDLKEMGKKARKYLENNYNTENAYKIIMSHFE